MQKAFWNDLDIVKLLAIVLVGAFVASVFLKVDSQTLTNLALLIAGYYWGSSTGSKTKEAALLPPPDAPKGA